MNTGPLFHISDQSGIAVFEPRMPPTPSAAIDTPVVWAVDAAHLPNYLVPRACPRVAFSAGPDTSAQDRERFIGHGGATHVVAIEAAWFERAAGSALWVYALEPEPFDCTDANAGYFVSAVAVRPLGCRRIERPLAEMLAACVELRVVPSLLALADAVARSSLAFSCIRMRNARDPLVPKPAA